MLRAELMSIPSRDPRDGSAATASSERRPEGALHELIEGLSDDSRELEARFQGLDAVAALLHGEIEASRRRLRLLVTQLELLEKRLGRDAGSVRAARHEPSAAPPCVARSASDAALPYLAAREREVLRLLTEGLRSPCIAQKLGIKTATVEVHRRNIMRKLNLHSIAALTKYALRVGITSL